MCNPSNTLLFSICRQGSMVSSLVSPVLFEGPHLWSELLFSWVIWIPYVLVPLIVFNTTLPISAIALPIAKADWHPYMGRLGPLPASGPNVWLISSLTSRNVTGAIPVYLWILDIVATDCIWLCSSYFVFYSTLSRKQHLIAANGSWAPITKRGNIQLRPSWHFYMQTYTGPEVCSNLFSTHCFFQDLARGKPWIC